MTHLRSPKPRASTIILFRLLAVTVMLLMTGRTGSLTQTPHAVSKFPPSRSPVIEWISTTSNLSWTQEPYLSFTPFGAPSIIDPGSGGKPDVMVLAADTFQTIKGFGACFNELGWTSLQFLSSKRRASIFRELFAPGVGACFTICRMPMGANDFSRSWYSYDETSGDFELRHFSISNDLQTLVPFIRSARQYNAHLQLWASPWSPPSWMKKNGHYACAVSGQDTKKEFRNGLSKERQGREGYDQFITEDRYFRSYALYFRRFIESYLAFGIPIETIMPQNEFNSCEPFPSCIWTSASLARFIGAYLAPEMQRTGTGIFFGTMERSNMRLLDTVMNDPLCARHVQGVGLQWAGKGALPLIYAKYPHLQLYQSEQECGDGKNDWDFCCYAWELMKLYLSNGVNAYMYWNLVLPQEGLSHWGWPQNSLITVDTILKIYRYNHEYYLMKHLSHFVRPGAKKIGTVGAFGDLLSFLNPDGTIVIVLRNAIKFSRVIRVGIGKSVISPLLKPDSFNTFVIHPVTDPGSCDLCVH